MSHEYASLVWRPVCDTWFCWMPHDLIRTNDVCVYLLVIASSSCVCWCDAMVTTFELRQLYELSWCRTYNSKNYTIDGCHSAHKHLSHRTVFCLFSFNSSRNVGRRQYPATTRDSDPSPFLSRSASTKLSQEHCRQSTVAVYFCLISLIPWMELVYFSFRRFQT